MFQDSKVESVYFESTEKVIRTHKDSNSQTTEIDQKEKMEQTTERHSIEVQTEPTASSNIDNVDYEKLSSFLNRIYPKLSKELEKSASSHFFANYEPNWDGDEPHKVYSLVKQDDEIYQHTKYNEMKITGLSWSCTGSVIAISFSYQTHEAWCTHETRIKLFNINSQHTKNSDKIIEVNSCVTCLAFHQNQPSILAAGTYNGDLLIYNFKNDNPLFATSKLPHSHKEKVTCIRWIKNTDLSSTIPYLLVSTGIDGRILIWNVNINTDTFLFKEGFAISTEHTKLYKIAKTPAGGTNDTLGISCFDFSHYNSAMFIIAVDGGGIFVCSTLSKVPALVESEIPLFDPVIKHMEKHEGVVTSVLYFLDQELMFLSSGTDKEIRLYNLEISKPVKVFYLDWPVFGIDWHLNKLNVFIAWGDKNEIVLYNCTTYQEIDKFCFKRDNEEKINYVVFNKQSSSLMAIGDIIGQVDIWKISFLRNLET